MAKLKKLLTLLPVLAISLTGIAGCTEEDDDTTLDDTVPGENEEGGESEESDGTKQNEGEGDGSSSGSTSHGYGSDDYIDENGHDTSSDLPEDSEHHEEHIVLPSLYLHENYDSNDNLVFTHEGENGDHHVVTLQEFESEMETVEIYVSTRRGLEGALELLRCVDFDEVGLFDGTSENTLYYAELMGYGNYAGSENDASIVEEYSWKDHALWYAEIQEDEKARTTNVTIEIDHDLDLTSSYYLEKSESGYGRHYSVSTRSYSLVCDVPYVTIKGADETEDQVILKVPSGILIHADDVTLQNFILLGENIHYWTEEGNDSTYGPSEIVGVTKGSDVLLKDLVFSRHESWDHDRYTYDTFDYSRCVTMFYGAESLTIDGCSAKGYMLDGVAVEYLYNGTNGSLTIINSDFNDIIRYALSVTFNNPCEGTRATPNGDSIAYPDSSDPAQNDKDTSTRFGKYTYSNSWFYNAETDYGYADSFELTCEDSSFSGYVRVFNHRACVTSEVEEESEDEAEVLSGPTEITPIFHSCSFHFGLHDYKDNIYGIYETDADSHFSYCEFENIGFGESYSIANDDRWESGAHRYLFAPATLTTHDSRGHIFETHRYSCTIGLYWPHAYRYAADGETLQTSYYIGENNIYHHITYEWLEDLAPNEDPDKACGFYLHKDASTDHDENGNHLPGVFDTDNLFFPHEWDEDLVTD